MGYGYNFAAIAVLGYLSKQMSDNTADNNSEPQDEGVRIQVEADIDNRIPVLYGDAYFGGYGVDFERTADLKTAYYVLALSEITGPKLDATPVSYTFHDVYLDDARVIFRADGFTVDKTIDLNGNEDESMGGLIKIYMYAPMPLQPDGAVGTTPQSYDVIPSWNIGTHLMSDLMYAIVELTYNKSKNVAQLPKCTFHMESNLTLPGDVLNDYATNARYGAGIDSGDVNTAQMTALNVYGAAGFTYTDIGLSPQSGIIGINGLVDTGKKVMSNMEDICRSVNAWLVYDSHVGEWGARINEAGSSVISFNDSNVIGEIKVTGTSLTQLYNVADVRFQNTDILDNTDFVKITTPPGELKANEPDTTMTINLPYTNKQVVATKIGLVALKQARADKAITFRTDYSYLNVDAGEIIDITSAEFGYTNKLFRIISLSEFDTLNGIEVEFSCIEYDPDVYVYSIDEFAIETDDGVLGIGSIGTPNTPSVVDNGTSNIPHVIINAVVPSGIVDTIEFWVTFDVLVPLDIDRVYIKVGETSNTNGTLYIENDPVDFRYGQLSTGDFHVKVRGANNVNAGPFSLPSGLVAYEAVQVTDQVTDNQMSFGAQLLQLGTMLLINNIDALFDGDGVATAEEAIMKKFFPASYNGIDDFATAAAADTDFVNQVGAAIGNAPVLIGQLNDVDTTTVPPTLNDILHWDGANWVPAPEPAGGLGGFGGTREVFGLSLGYVKNSFWNASPGTIGSPRRDIEVPYEEDLFITWGIIGDNIVDDLVAGSGNVTLYKSDGTVAQTLAAGALTYSGATTQLPFADRDPCTDYYIIVDPGTVRYGDQSDNIGLCNPYQWAFRTTPADITIPVEGAAPNQGPPGAPGGPAGPVAPPCRSFDRKATFTINYGYNIIEGDGLIRIKKDEVNAFAIRICECEISATSITTPEVILDYEATYYAQADAGAVVPVDENGGFITQDVKSAELITPSQEAPPGEAFTDDQRSGTSALELNLDQQIVPGTGGSVRVFTKSGTLLDTFAYNDPAITVPAQTGVEITAIAVSSPRLANGIIAGQDNVSLTTNIEITFSENVVPDVGQFHLYNGITLVQSFDLMDYFVTTKLDKAITYINNTVIIDPTVCLLPGIVYHIEVDANAVMGRCGNTFAAVTGTSWQFTTIAEVIPTVSAPAISNGALTLNVPGSIQKINSGGGPDTDGENLVGGEGKVQIKRKSDNALILEHGFDYVDRFGNRVANLQNSEK